ncbi:MAG: GTP cyclohydrolase II [Acetobacteraceae bacterium]|nr:GTP cyclohydrolase II [Acetobacteraceae bacterium]
MSVNPAAAGADPEPNGRRDSALTLRNVQRAVADLRAGLPILLAGADPLVLLAAETAGPSGIAEFKSLSAEPPLLLLAPVRAATVSHRPVEQTPSAAAVQMIDSMLAPAILHGLADPTAPQITAEPAHPAPPPGLAGAALALAKTARLLPAVLAAPPGPHALTAAAKLELLTAAADDVLAYPHVSAATLVRVAEAHLPLEGAPDSCIVAFRGPDAGLEHLAILVGQPRNTDAPLVRLHSQCFTGDLLGSLRCDCGSQLRGAIRRMAQEGAGALLYLAQEGRGIGLINKLRAYALQDRGLDTLDANRALGWDADERNFLIAAAILRELGINRVRLLTNNPAKITALAASGVEVIGRESLAFAPNGVNDAYLATKAKRFGHLFG